MKSYLDLYNLFATLIFNLYYYLFKIYLMPILNAFRLPPSI
jgi:hypothetical protein